MKDIYFSRKPLIMGIVNITPDSFYDGGKYMAKEPLKERIENILHEGADILDIGGESSRPGAEPVSLEEEFNRVRQALSLLQTRDVCVSVDTYKSKVAEEALKNGATIINDISGLRFDREMPLVIRDFDAYVVIMHMKGSPKNMQKNPDYNNVVMEIRDFFNERIEFALSKGIKKERIILDPGIGFGKKQEHNIEILKNINLFKAMGFPLLIGHSRKSLIGYLTGKQNPTNRLYGTLGLSAYLILNHVDIIRVHDVQEHKDVLKALLPFKDIDNSTNFT